MFGSQLINNCSIAFLSFTSPRYTLSLLPILYFCCSSYSRSCRPVSVWSLIIRLSGFIKATCRASSEPMEPAAPVISTFFSRKKFVTAVFLNCMGGLPNNSSIFTPCNWFILRWPCIHVLIGGMFITLTWCSRHSSTILFLTCMSMLSLVKNRYSICIASIIVGRLIYGFLFLLFLVFFVCFFLFFFFFFFF